MHRRPAPIVPQRVRHNRGMSVVRHLIIAHAAPPAGASAPDGLSALRGWLARAVEVSHHAGDALSLTPPHEHALARALGWPVDDGRLPWAAWTAGRTDVACAWLWPCHWQAGLDHLTIIPPHALDLRPDEAVALRQAFADHAAQDGVTLHGDDPWRWLAEGALFEGWRSASLDRVAHRRVDTWWRDAGADPAARALLRLLNEAQMLFHAHPVNAARAQRGALPVNGLWVSGAGRWGGDGPTAAGATVRCLDDLLLAAITGDALAWMAAWQRIDAQWLAPWLAAAERDGEPRWLTLCGERGWRCWRLDPGVAPPPPPRLGWRARWRRWWGGSADRAAAASSPALDWWSGL